MKKATPCLLFAGILAIMLALGTSGCATKDYVNARIANTNSKVSALEAKNIELANKEQAGEEHMPPPIARWQK